LFRLDYVSRANAYYGSGEEKRYVSLKEILTQNDVAKRCIEERFLVIERQFLDDR